MDEISSKQKDFFISYSNVDIHWAEWVAWQLEEEGYTLTLQAWDFTAGSNFVQDKDGALRGSKRIILILSQNYLDTDSVVTEWTASFRKNPETLLPVRVRECKPGGFLGSIVQCDLVGLNETEARERLLTSVQGKRNKPIKPPKFPIRHTTTQDKPDFPNVRNHPISLSQPASIIPLRRQRIRAKNQPMHPVEPPANPLPTKQKQSNRFRPEVHWLFPVGITVVILVILWMLGSAALAWGSQRLDDLRYGYPRTDQTDEVVGHDDSAKNPSHFIVVNLHQQIVVIEFMGGNIGKAITYPVPGFIAGQNGDLASVTLEFRDINGDGKLDMRVHIHLSGQDQISLFINTGTKFRPSNGSDTITL